MMTNEWLRTAVIIVSLSRSPFEHVVDSVGDGVTAVVDNVDHAERCERLLSLAEAMRSELTVAEAVDERVPE